MPELAPYKNGGVLPSMSRYIKIANKDVSSTTIRSLRGFLIDQSQKVALRCEYNIKLVTRL